MKRRIFNLRIDRYKKWVKALPFECLWVQPQGIGETLMYPHFIEALEYAKKHKKKTMFYTNASLLTPSMSEQILETDLDSITFSIDGFSEDTFKSRVGLSWKKTLNNITVFLHMKQKGGYHTETGVRGTITDCNKWKMFNYYIFWRGKTDKIGMVREVRFPSPNELDETPYAYSDKGFSCYHIFNQPDSEDSVPAITVLNNGNVVICCQDWFNDYVMANLYETNIVDAFNNKNFNEMRKGMITGTRYPLLCEYCRLSKINKNHLLSPYNIVVELMRAHNYRGKYLSVLKALITKPKR